MAAMAGITPDMEGAIIIIITRIIITSRIVTTEDIVTTNLIPVLIIITKIIPRTVIDIVISVALGRRQNKRELTGSPVAEKSR